MRLVYMRRNVLVACFCAAQAWSIAYAAPAPGILSGLVLDSRGAPAVAARVSWQAADGTHPHALHTNAQGQFRLSSLRPGLYDLRAEYNDMASDWEHNVLVRAGAESSVTLRMMRSTPAEPDQPVTLKLQGRVHEWTIPVEDALPQSIAVDPQGRVWVALANANQLGCLDLVTGKWKFLSIPTQFARPKGLISDAAGNIWFTENGSGKIGRVGLQSGAITEFSVAGAKNPDSAAFAADGTLWFTSDDANSITRMDTHSGEMKSFTLLPAQANPNGIVPGPDGGLWFYEAGVNKLARLDLVTGAVVEFPAPEEATRPRGIAFAGHSIYFTGTADGKLARFNIDTKMFQSWSGPAATAASQPYAVAADAAGAVWYSDTGANQVVRFDPKTENFQAFGMPSANSQVHFMMRDSRGRIWLTLSGVNKIAVIE